MAITMVDEEKEYYPSQCAECPMRKNCGFHCAGTHYTYDVEVITNIVAHKVIMSYIGSAKKHGMSAYTAILEAVNGRSLQTVQAWA